MGRRPRATKQHALGAYIQQRLDNLGRTQVWLAEASGLPKSTINAIINKGVEPELGSLARIAQALDEKRPEVMLGALMTVAGYPVSPATPAEQTQQRLALILEQAPWLEQALPRLVELPPDLQQQMLAYIEFQLEQQRKAADRRQ